MDLKTQYNPAEVEERIYKFWLNGNHFHAEPTKDLPSYSIIIPPPNVTAALHMGHALNNTLQDILIRYHRMKGENAVWIPGTDHAGIATQTVVEKRVLAEEGKKRTDFSREEFVRKIQAWKDEYEARILSQLKRMGCSCDWARTRFTMDKVCTRAVREAFFRLFRDGFVYRGKKLVNWDPATQTALADDEVEMKEVDGYFWYIRYPLKEPLEVDGKKIEYVVVATTRPETMLGDTAVAINPHDPRAKYLVGKELILPIVNRTIPIIADEYVTLPDPESTDPKARYSTGFLKVTPAHDPNDWQIGERHNLPIINVLAPDGTISDKYGWSDIGDAGFLLGLDRYKAREVIVEWLKEHNLLEEVKPYRHSIGHSYRSHVPIEPYLSDQWFVRVSTDEFRGAALRAMADDQYDSSSEHKNLRRPRGKPWEGKLRFFPERYAKIFQQWHENLRDWCISRQLWWGHRIPVWHGPDNVDESTIDKIKELGKERVDIKQFDGRFYVCIRNEEDTEAVKLVESLGFHQDEDVLDTWFSSALWPLSTMGWPEMTKELEVWNPTNVLCTAREIITLWVSRMVMFNIYFLDRLPFWHVYIHAMIQDGEGRKMSKSLGNGIDPVDIIEQYGADAMRYSLAYLTTGMQDIRMPVIKQKLPDGRIINTSERFEIGRNLCNKLWNATRFVLMSIQNTQENQQKGPFEPIPESDIKKLPLEDRWILSRLKDTIEKTTNALETYEFSDLATTAYRFFWNEFCDWYVELAKLRLKKNNSSARYAQQILAFVIDNILRIFHPMIPFITEELWGYLNSIAPERGISRKLDTSSPLIISRWPEAEPAWQDLKAESEMNLIQEIIRAIRDIRTNVNRIRSANNQKVIPSLPEIYINTSNDVIDVLESNREAITTLANVENLIIGERPSNIKGSIIKVVADSYSNTVQIIAPLADLIDVDKEIKRLKEKLNEVESHVKRSEERLTNENFLKKAPPHIIEEHRKRLGELKAKYEAIKKTIEELQ